jgi:hypothetical protein
MRLALRKEGPMSAPENDLMIIKECLEVKWETHRPEGDEKDLYERVLEQLRKGARRTEKCAHAPIPEDLQNEYDLAGVYGKYPFSTEFVRILIERIARLEAELEARKLTELTVLSETGGSK